MKLMKLLPMILGLALLALAVLATSGCARAPAPVETRVQIEKVPVAAPCPKDDVYDDLVRSRPLPLASQPMPATPEERVAKTEAQLGRYEAKGGWADKAAGALESCHNRGG